MSPRAASCVPFSVSTPRAQVIFWAVQLLYTLLTFLPAKLAFDHRGVCVLLIGVCVCVSVWNGANYYIEVFSTRYTLKFKEPPPGPGGQAVSPPRRKWHQVNACLGE